jgi:hypothetical protein
MVVGCFEFCGKLAALPDKPPQRCLVNKTRVAFLLALSNSLLFAQTVPPQQRPAGLQVIYGNLGQSQTNLYSTIGWVDVLGPGCSPPGPVFSAMPFTPKSNSHASQIRVPVQYGDVGANQVNLSIYTDSNGAPGALLAGPVTVTNLPNWATCCTLTTASFSPVALAGGSQYWIVADTPASGTGSDFCGTWNYVARTPPPIAYNQGKGWQVTSGPVVQLAGEVLGTLP